MKAKKKPVTIYTAEILGIGTKPMLQVLNVEEPPAQKWGSKFDNVDAVVTKLKEIGAT